MLRRLLFKLAKGPLMGRIVGHAFRYGSWAIPVKKVYVSKEIIAFCHPQPSYEHHLILSPKRAVRNLQEMASERFSGYLAKVWEAAGAICEAHPEYHDGFVLMANGGKRQEVQQVHFHMFTNHEVVKAYTAQAENAVDRAGEICLLAHPAPEWEIHFVVTPASPLRMAGDEEAWQAYFTGVLRSIGLLDEKLHIVQRGYSLVCRRGRRKSDMDYPVFHIISGKKRT